MATKNTVTQEQVNKVLGTAQVQTINVLGKPVTLVGVRFPNGFVLIETSVCVDPKNYDEKIGAKVCLEHLESKIWSYLGFQLQTELASKEEAKPKYVQGELFKNADLISKD